MLVSRFPPPSRFFEKQQTSGSRSRGKALKDHADGARARVEGEGEEAEAIQIVYARILGGILGGALGELAAAFKAADAT